MRRLNLIWPNTGSIIAVASSIDLAAELGGQERTHPGISPAAPARPGPSAFGCVGWDQHRDPVGGELVHLLAVPVAGVSEHHRRLLFDARAGQLGAGGRPPV